MSTNRDTQDQQADEDSDLDLTEGIDNDQADGGGNDDDDQDDGQGGNDDNDDDDQDDQLPAWVSGFEQRMTSVIDRRINSAMNKGNRRQPPPGNRTGRQQDRQQEQRTSAPADERGARMTLRETLNDGFTFLSPEEKTMAIQYGRDKIAALAARGFEDPDVVGEQVAGEVRAFVEGNRKFYSGRTKSLLKKKGLLIEQAKEKDSSPGKGVGDAKKGADTALARRQQITPGYKPPGQ